jgi:hypothetical protein
LLAAGIYWHLGRRRWVRIVAPGLVEPVPVEVVEMVARSMIAEVVKVAVRAPWLRWSPREEKRRARDLDRLRGTAVIGQVLRLLKADAFVSKSPAWFERVHGSYLERMTREVREMGYTRRGGAWHSGDDPTELSPAEVREVLVAGASGIDETNVEAVMSMVARALDAEGEASSTRGAPRVTA